MILADNGIEITLETILVDDGVEITSEEIIDLTPTQQNVTQQQVHLAAKAQPPHPTWQNITQSQHTNYTNPILH